MFYILKYPNVRRKIENEIKTLLLPKKHQTNSEAFDDKVTLDDILKIEKEDLDKFVILGMKNNILMFTLLLFLTFVYSINVVDANNT